VTREDFAPRFYPVCLIWQAGVFIYNTWEKSSVTPLSVFFWAHWPFLFAFPQQVCSCWWGEREKNNMHAFIWMGLTLLVRISM